MTLDEVVTVLDRWFPPTLAESWDNVGLLLGDRQAEVRSVMTCLTVTPESADEAIREHADLIVAHHPILFRPIQRLVADGVGGPVFRLARSGVAVYSPHTAFDGASEGINGQIAERLDLTSIVPLRPAATDAAFKVVVFVPEGDLEAVRSAAFRAGAGVIGEYDDCGFRVAGTGSFRGSDRSNPTVGERGRREEVAEHRLEFVTPGRQLGAVTAALVEVHSYEEPAYDVYPLHPSAASAMGAGRIGVLSDAMRLDRLAARVKTVLPARHVEFVGPSDRMCRRLAIGCGAGAEFLEDARRLGCDALITGEARFHQCLAARAAGVGLVLAGHYATERFAVETLAARIARWSGLSVWSSRDERDPIEAVV